MSELGKYIDKTVSDLTYQAWSMRQVPQMKMMGSNFPLVSKTASLLPVVIVGPNTIVPTRPTHVVITPVSVRQSANERGGHP